MFFTLCLWILMPSFAFKEFGSLFQTIGAKYESASCPRLVFEKVDSVWERMFLVLLLGWPVGLKI